MLASVALLAGGGAPAFADGPAPAKGAGDSALEAADKVRAAIPAPEEEKGLAWTWEGDLEVAGERAGSVKYGADVGEWKGDPIWVATEETVEESGGSRRSTEVSLYLARDLTLIRGEWRQSTAGDTLAMSFVRRPDGLHVERQRETAEGTTPLEPVVVPAPERGVLGRVALLLFLRYAPKGAASYALPQASLDAALPAAGEHAAPPDPGPVRLEVKGPGKFGRAPDVADTWFATVRQGVRVFEVHLAPADRRVVGIEHVVPPGIRVVAKGKAAKATLTDDDKPSATWRGAYWKFGHGYHLAVERWIEGAFHWKSMYDHEVAAGGWPKELPLEDFRKAYVGEFLAKSKHRARGEADALLTMTLATSTEKTLPDGTVVLSTHAEFGGNVFHFRAVDGAWYIVRIDQ